MKAPVSQGFLAVQRRIENYSNGISSSATMILISYAGIADGATVAAFGSEPLVIPHGQPFSPV